MNKVNVDKLNSDNAKTAMLLDVVALEGTLMLSGGSEVYRVEETMRRALAHFGYDTADMLVLTTGIFVTLDNHTEAPVTMIKRVQSRGLNISRISEVNAISRALCDDSLSLEEAYERLNGISGKKQYNALIHAVGIMAVSAFFAPMFGGGIHEFAGAVIAGALYAAADHAADRCGINSFCSNMLCACVIALTALFTKAVLLTGADSDIIIMSAIMPLVPGSTFLTAIRDMLNGDYSSGTARIMEAAVTALAIAAGVGFGMLLFRLCG